MATSHIAPYQSPFPALPTLGWPGSDPFQGIVREMGRLFDETFRGLGGLPTAFGAAALASPRLDMRESDKELCVIADLPGVSQSEVDLRVEDDMLTITAERRGETPPRQARDPQNYHVMERSHGVLWRTVQLPFPPDTEQIRADFKDGVLTVRMPKPAPSQPGRRIPIQQRGQDPAQAQAVAAGDAGQDGGDADGALQAAGAAGESDPGGAAG